MQRVTFLLNFTMSYDVTQALPVHILITQFLNYTFPQRKQRNNIKMDDRAIGYRFN